ncbi:hypothetical protein [Sphingomonas gei]|nr:hypothetical protein [Sphingomonas gei]
MYMYSSRERIGDANTSGYYCSRDGRFGRGVVGLRSYGFGTFYPLWFDHYNLAAGVDSAGSTYFAYVAPLGSLIYSPATSLIEFADSQVAVKRALGLDTGIFKLMTDPDLTKFDPVVALLDADDATHREGARVAAANLRAGAVAIGVDTVRQGRFDPYFLFVQQGNVKFVGEFVATRQAFLFDNSVMSDLLTSAVPAGKYRADVLSAAAHLIGAYAAAIGVQIDTTTSATQFNLGLIGYLRTRLGELLEANTAEAAARALAVTAPQIIDQTAIFREALPLPTTGFFFPGPDFFVASAGAPLIITADGLDVSTLVSNDIYANGPTGSIGFFPASSSVLSVSVPSINSAELTAVLASGKVTVTALNGFKGYTYFDYAVRHPSGEEGAARVYVNFQ